MVECSLSSYSRAFHKASRKLSRHYLSHAIAGALAMGFSLSVQAIDGVPPYPAVMPLSSLVGDQTGFRMDGIQADQRSGYSLAGIGDFNHDGKDDIAIGAPFTDFPPQSNNGAVYVVFGRQLPFSFPSNANLSGVLTIKGVAASQISWVVSRAGDVNDDGTDDLLIAEPISSNSTGTVYVLFGGASLTNTVININTLSSNQGFIIEGTNRGDGLGFSVSAAGDFNGDDIDDILLSVPYACPNGQTLAGSSYVIFGHKVGVTPSQPFPVNVDIRQFDGQSAAKLQNGSGNLSGYVNGFRIDGAVLYGWLGYNSISILKRS